MEFFVTGATGFLGGALVRQLLEADHEVTALVRSPAKASTLPEGADPVEGDVTEKTSLRAGIEGVDGVFHLAGWFRVGPAAYDHARRVNVDGTRNVLELVEEFAVDRAVYTSTLAVNSDTGGEVVDETHRYDGPHLSAYDRSKWEAHYEVAVPMIAEGLPLVIAMPGVIYGPGDTSDLGELWRRYLVGDLPVIPRRTAYCWGHVEDTARALRSAMRRGTPGESYIVAGEPATLVEAMAIAEGVTGIPSPRPVSPAWFRGMRGDRGRDRAVRHPPGSVHGRIAPRLRRRHLPRGQHQGPARTGGGASTVRDGPPRVPRVGAGSDRGELLPGARLGGL